MTRRIEDPRPPSKLTRFRCTNCLRAAHVTLDPKLGPHACGKGACHGILCVVKSTKEIRLERARAEIKAYEDES